MTVPSITEKILVKIEVHVDTLCPWCYIEKRSLDAAMRQFQDKHPEVEFEVLWRPFYLYPMLDSGCDKATFYEGHAKNNASPALQDKIRAAGTQHDITFRLSSGATGSSRNSHKLIALALQQRDPVAQARVVEHLFRGHFEQGRDLTDDEWLVSVGCEAAGLEPEDVRRALGSDLAGLSVDDEVRCASVERGVRAVPCVTMQGRYRVGGYQEQGVFEDLFEKILKNGGS